MGPRRCSTPRQTGWLTVSCKVTWTWKWPICTSKRHGRTFRSVLHPPSGRAFYRKKTAVTQIRQTSGRAVFLKGLFHMRKGNLKISFQRHLHGYGGYALFYLYWRSVKVNENYELKLKYETRHKTWKVVSLQFRYWSKSKHFSNLQTLHQLQIWHRNTWQKNYKCWKGWSNCVTNNGHCE
jgi:hypothetical protein